MSELAYKPLTDAEILRLADLRYFADDIEQDEDVSISRAEDGSGAFVRAWVWVAAEHADEGDQ